MAGQNWSGMRFAQRKPVQFLAATVLSLKLLTGGPAVEPIMKAPVYEYQLKDPKGFEEKKKTDPKAAELENAAREKLGHYMTLLLEKYPQFADEIRFRRREIAVEAVSPEELDRLGGNRLSKTVGVKPGEGNRQIYLISREGFTDFDLAMAMARDALSWAKGGFDFEPPPFCPETDIETEALARLFAGHIQKPKLLEKANSDQGWITLFVSMLGEEGYLKLFMDGDTQIFVQKFDELFGKGAFTKICEYASKGPMDEVYFQLWKLINAHPERDRIVKQLQETGAKMGLLIEEPK